jgi:hypothetical protein
MMEEGELVSVNRREQKNVAPNVTLLPPSMVLFCNLQAISKAMVLLPAPAWPESQNTLSPLGDMSRIHCMIASRMLIRVPGVQPQRRRKASGPSPWYMKSPLTQTLSQSLSFTLSKNQINDIRRRKALCIPSPRLSPISWSVSLKPFSFSNLAVCL